mgnify:CR=1 FL=1
MRSPTGLATVYPLTIEYNTYITSSQDIDMAAGPHRLLALPGNGLKGTPNRVPISIKAPHPTHLYAGTAVKQRAWWGTLPGGLPASVSSSLLLTQYNRNSEEQS